MEIEPKTENQRVLILDDECDITSLHQNTYGYYQGIILLFWLSPKKTDQIAEEMGTSCYSMIDLKTNTNGWEEQANAIVDQICNRGPQYMGLPLRRLIDEPLFRTILNYQLIQMVLTFIDNEFKATEKNKILIEYVLSPLLSNCIVLADKFKDRQMIFRSLNRKSIDTRNSRFKRIVKRMKEIATVGNVKGHVWHIVAELDNTYRWRCSWQLLFPIAQAKTNGVCFFSSYRNNSLTLSNLTDFMPAPVTWILTNQSAQSGLPEGAKWEWIWRFSKASMNAMTITHRISSQDDDADIDDFLRALLKITPTWQYWQDHGPKSLLNLANCWMNYLERARPILIVVANQWGLDGWLALMAQGKGIPVLQIMHGALGGYFFTRTPIRTDKMMVYGEFWKNLWPEAEQSKICVFNPGRYKRILKKDRSGFTPRLTCFSWPLKQVLYHHFVELNSGLIHIFHRLLEEKVCKLIYRAHPGENPDDFLSLWRTLHGTVPTGVNVSKHEHLADIISDTSMAFMYRSTVIMDCIVNSIPVMMPGWIDYGWHEALQDVPGVYLAADFSDLEMRIREWVKNPPVVDEAAVYRFVRPLGEGEAEFREMVRRLAEGRK